MKRNLKAVQMACYQSNLGDNANVVGLRSQFSKNMPVPVEYSDWELLDYSWGLARYDEATIDWVNQHDVMIFGGGGFLELVATNPSWTGTRFNIPLDLFEKIKIPIIFHGVGIDVARGVPEESARRLKKFFDILFSSDQYMVSTRNDGSMETLRRIFGESYASQVSVVPDGGFFTYTPPAAQREIFDGNRVISINLAGDMIGDRFPVRRVRKKSKPEARHSAPVTPADYENALDDENSGLDQFLDRFADLLNHVLNSHQDIRIVLVPHIYKDISICAKLIARLGFPACRRRAVMAPYVNGQAGHDYVFEVYRKSSVVIGMRFHANVCPMGLHVPTIGIDTYPQIPGLYRDLGLPERALKVGADDLFENSMLSMIEDALSGDRKISTIYSEMTARLTCQIGDFHRRVAKLLKI